MFDNVQALIVSKADFKIEKSSKVLAYDISLRNAILKSIMPTEVGGHEFVLMDKMI